MTTDWQDIATAPRDGSIILLIAPSESWTGAAYWHAPGKVWICFRRNTDGYPDGHTFMWAFNAALTHWMPLPEPPQ